jgi:hypothetical protein
VFLAGASLPLSLHAQLGNSPPPPPASCSSSLPLERHCATKCPRQDVIHFRSISTACYHKALRPCGRRNPWLQRSSTTKPRGAVELAPRGLHENAPPSRTAPATGPAKGCRRWRPRPEQEAAADPTATATHRGLSGPRSCPPEKSLLFHLPGHNRLLSDRRLSRLYQHRHPSRPYRRATQTTSHHVRLRTDVSPCPFPTPANHLFSASSIERRASSVEHRASSIEHWDRNLGCTTLPDQSANVYDLQLHCYQA